MPILLDDIQNNVPQNITKSFSPKFFDEKLTGRGGTVGYISQRNDPVAANIQNIATQHNHFMVLQKRTYQHNDTKTHKIPVNPLTPEAWKAIHTMPTPDLSDLYEIGNSSRNNINAKLYIKMRITALTLEETTVTKHYGAAPTLSKKIIPTYQVAFFHIPDPTPGAECQQAGKLTGVSATTNQFTLRYSSNPIVDWNQTFLSELQYNYNINNHAVMDYLQTYSLYDTVERASEIWQTTIHEYVDLFLKNIKLHYYSNFTNAQNVSGQTRRSNYNTQPNVNAKQIVYHQIKYLINYNIPLELYKHIYASVENYFSATEAQDICKQNLNLLLSDTLNNLDANKHLLQSFKTPPTKPVPAHINKLSTEQIKAVTATEPLVLTQAGAGTGKSTIILARIDYLIACGVDPNDITVLSFTNAAADHITQKNANVHSMTIARMIHEIYTTNFKNHDLSTLSTIRNSLEIYFQKETRRPGTVEYVFAHCIEAMIKNEPNNFTEMNNFIETNYDEVMRMLDTIRQTSLELEIIICYQKIDSLKEPDHIASKYLIIDEVQDNSVFEFIYTLKYVNKHKESLFIVGDCSQTLYEFRSSNPRALNILEGSGTFATYQLNINYRSNQEILDFANILLGNIEANQYARIQLRANSRAQVTEQSFLEKVHFNYHPMPNIGQFKDELPGIMHREVKPYIDDCLARDEPITFLAFTRRDINTFYNILRDMYPNIKEEEILNLVPQKVHPVNVMTNFIKYHWDKMTYLPLTNVCNLLISEIRKKSMLYGATNTISQQADAFLNKWRKDNKATIDAWEHQVQNGQITKDQFFDMIRDNMIAFEIKENGIKQSVISSNNQELKLRNRDSAKILLSTIHSAKGLEFDNVVILYRNDNQMAEDKKRMYYVAFTRAMKTEYILAYDTMQSPQIEADYLTVLSELHDKSPAPNSPFNQGRNPLKL